MIRFLIALASTGLTIAPLVALDGMPSTQAARAPATAPAARARATTDAPIIGADRPIFLGRMVVTATPLPEAPGR
jgi:hypothetical protein